MTVLRVLCFGPPRVVRDGAALPPGSVQPRRLALLAILAAAGDRPVPRDRVCALLWPDSDEEKSRRSLAQALYALRRDFGTEDVIEGVRDLRLNPSLVSTDVADFQRFRDEGQFERAAACYTGHFLDGFELAGLPDFERWVETERSAWAGQYRVAVEQLAADADAHGDARTAVTWWRKALAHDVHNARLTVRLMRALARAGDRAGAVRQAEIYETLVRNDLEIEPDPAVLNEARAIREAATPAVITAESPAVRRPDAPAPPAAAPASTAEEEHDGKLVDLAGLEPRLAPPAAPPPDTDSSGASTRPAPPPRARWPWAAAAPIAALLLWLFAGRRDAARSDGAPSPARVLVLPPRNGTGDPSFDLAGAMAAEWITNGLVQTGLVDVIDSRSMLSATAPGASEASVREFAAGAGVGTLVTGSVFRDGDSLRFNVDVVEAGSGRVIRSITPVSAPVTRPTAALEPLRQSVIGSLAVLFDVRLHNLTATTSQPPTWEAYREFLLGMRAFGADYPQAVAHFQRAVRLDSSYWQARLWSGIAMSNMRRYPEADSIYRSLDPARDRFGPYDIATLDYFQQGFVEGNWERSYRGARRMVELAPGAGHALYALGTTATFTLRTTEAVQTLRRIDIERGWGVGWALRVQNLICRAEHQAGRHAEELADARRMREIDESAGWARVPEVIALAALRRRDELQERVALAMTLPASTDTWEVFSPGDMLVSVALELHAHGDSAESARYLRQAREWHQSLDERARGTPAARLTMARALYAAGRWSEAASAYAELLATDSTVLDYRAGTALVAAHEGDTVAAARTLRALQDERRRFRFGAPALWAARIAAALGRREEAVSLLRRAISEGFARIYLVHTDPDLRTLRGFPAFEELLRPRD